MTEKLIKRDKMEQIMEWMDRPEVIAIKGPRQAGKTTLLSLLYSQLQDKGIAEQYIQNISFENKRKKGQFEQNPLKYTKSLVKGKERNYIFFDEYQYIEDGGQKLKLIYDELQQVKIVITGSNSLELADETARYMVGRMFSTELYPLNFREFLRYQDEQLYRIYKQHTNEKVGKKRIEQLQGNTYEQDFRELWIEYVTYGGYPAVVTEDKTDLKEKILEEMVETYIEKDILRLLDEEGVKKFRDMTRVLASQSGQLLNYNQLADDTETNFRKVKHFLSILEETFVVKRLHPLKSKLTTELKKNPKSYITDSGLRNSLVGNFATLKYRSDKGELAETSVLSDILAQKKSRTELLYWRTTGGAEVDFILRQGENIIPIEVKYKKMKNTKISKSMHSYIDAYQPDIFFVLTRGFWGYEKKDQTKVKFIPMWYFSNLEVNK